MTYLEILTLFFGEMGQKNGIAVCFFVFLSLSANGQLDNSQSDEQNDIQQTLQTIIEDFTEFNDGEAEFDFNTLYEDLLAIYANKININQATQADLSQLIFLSDADVQNILAYRNSYGDFVSIYELQSVPGLTFDKMSSLRLFVEVTAFTEVKNPLNQSALKSAKNNIYFKWKYNIETNRGFKSENGNDPKYIGDKNHYYIRYNHSGPDERYGAILEKDPGERIFNSYAETGIDYVSVHYQKKNVTPLIKQFNLGDYSVSMGQGLVAHSAFGVGKSSLTTSIKKGRGGIRAYNSVSENLAFRGMAMELGDDKSPLSALVFASYIPRDANLGSADTVTFATSFTSLPQGGLHRTEGERQDQDATYELTVGSSINYNLLKNVNLGLNIIHHDFDRAFNSKPSPYQLYRWQGDQLTNMSVDYNALISGWNLYGEVARSSTDGWAQMHGLIKTLDPKFDIAMVYRDYGARYQNLYANGFGESVSVNNEQGLYVGVEFRPSKKWSVRAFVDNWKNDWLRFRVDGPSTGQEYLLRVDFKERRKRHLYMQYRYEVKDENSAADLLVDVPVAKTIQRLRLHASHNLADGIELRSRIEGSLYHKENETSRGIMVYQDLISRKSESPLTLSARIAYFNISDSDARIYSYENDLLFEYYIPSFNGEGLRYYALARYNISRSIMAEIRWEQTKYFDREFISSGNNLIEGSVQSRVKAQVRWRF